MATMPAVERRSEGPGKSGGAGGRGVAFAVALAALAVLYLWFPNLSPSFVSPNELSRILLTRAIVEDGTLAIDRGVARQGEEWSDLARFGGHYFSDKAPGLAVAAAPVYALARRLVPGEWTDARAIWVCRLALVTLPALAALAFALRSAARSGALDLVFALACGSVLYPQALSFTAHVPVALLLFGAFLGAARGARGARRAGCGLLLGLAEAFDYSAAIGAALIAVFAAVGAARGRARGDGPVRAIAELAAGALAPVALLAAYHAACFAGPFDLAYRHMVRAADEAHRATGFFGASGLSLSALWGLTFGGERGLFLHSPFLLACVPAALRLRRRGAFDASETAAAAIAAAYLLFNATLVDWQGGWSLGPRYLAPALPFLLWPVVRARELAPSAATGIRAALAQAATGVAIGWAVALHLASVATWPLPPFGTALRFPALEVATYLLAQHVVAWNWGFALGLSGWASLAVPAAAGSIGVALALSNSSRTGRDARRNAIAGAALGVLLLVGVARSVSATWGEEQLRVLRELPGRMGYSVVGGGSSALALPPVSLARERTAVSTGGAPASSARVARRSSRRRPRGRTRVS